MADTSIVDYNATYRLPTITIASKKITSCFVDINLDTQMLIVQTDYSNIHTDMDVNLPKMILIFLNNKLGRQSCAISLQQE